jgi:hypothetical protein
MKKILLLSALLCAISIKMFAQNLEDKHFTVAVDAGLPVGNASNFYSVGIGADLKYSYTVASNVSISLSAGYTEFIGKDFNYSYVNYDPILGSTYNASLAGRVNNGGIIPVKAGVRYFANAKGGLFVEAQAGAAFSTQSGDGVAFAYSPGVGYTFTNGFEIGGRYEGWSKDGTFGQAALRVAFRL